jgi:hypothetical protein
MQYQAAAICCCLNEHRVTLCKLPTQECLRQECLELPLQGTLDWAGAIDWVETLHQQKMQEPSVV